ncbi:MAG: methyltransferase domain-containing protein [Anaerolineae bacterium]|nr:methyltransferase domain-containing protein [Anaerolineae bacterium]
MEAGEETQDLKRTTQNAIQALYRRDAGHEWDRIERHRTEFAVSLRAMEEHLPAPPAAILDCGGGPGRYAITLAQRGYEVTLFDLSPELLEMAQEKAAQAGVTLSGFEQGTATDLSRFADGQFDAVLLMGPLYHLLDETDRQQALAEAARVAKPGGPVFAAFIARYACYIDTATKYPQDAVDHPEIYELIEETGLLPPRADGRVAFVAYFAHPNEVVPLCRSTGLDVVTVLGVEGVVSLRDEAVNALTGDAWERWVDINYRIAHDPCAHGGVEHLLAVCRRPKWRALLRDLGQDLQAHGVDYRLVGGAALALRGLDVEVADLDLEMPKVEAYAFGERLAESVVLPVAWRETETTRSHYGRFEIDGVPVDVIAELERKIGGRWVPTFGATHETVDLGGVAISVLSLEEETLAYLRRGRLGRVSLALPHCNKDRFLTLLRQAQAKGWF